MADCAIMPMPWNFGFIFKNLKYVKLGVPTQYHLAGTKKVQQELAKPGVLEQFLVDDEEAVEAVRGVFTGLYPIDDRSEAGKKAFALALSEPDRFVLKPQREGGGNNIYGQDIGPFLRKIRDSSERDAYILMDRISPPKTMNYIVSAADSLLPFWRIDFPLSLKNIFSR